MIPEISCSQLDDPNVTPEGFKWLDVREPHEHDWKHIPDSTFIPLNELPTRYTELDPTTPWIVYCRSGQRSAYATAFLQSKGFLQVFNLKEGILGWLAKETT